MPIHKWPVEPRYGDTWKTLKQAMFEAAVYEMVKKLEESEN